MMCKHLRLQKQFGQGEHSAVYLANETIMNRKATENPAAHEAAGANFLSNQLLDMN